jgi:ATPase family associated with various cellular activities (AAA)
MPEPETNAYLEEGLKSDRAELEHVRDLIDETTATLLQVRKDDRWPYVVRDGEETEAPTKVSASTNSMIAFALAAAYGTGLESPLAPHAPALDLLGHRTAAVVETTDEGDLLKLLASATQAVVDAAESSGALRSGTYGRNDPFTLGWLVPLLAALEISWSEEATVVKQRLDGAWSKKPGERLLFKPNRGAALPHAFSLLRVVHLTKSAAALKLSEAPDLPADLADEFATTVHRQLSNSEIGDASFDPAELIFAFEGLLLSPGGEPSRALVDRLFDVVASAQKRSPSWRPLRPFIRTETGLVLLPLSIEGATSLARICRNLDERDRRDRRFSRLIEEFRTYFQWLESQRVHITVGGEKLSGWHSEHVRETKTIYTWQTSQVLLFLVLYRELLQTHVAERALAAANLSIKRNPEPGPKPEKSAAWERVWTTFLRRADNDSLEQTSNRSAVLYGPPGTGKTTLAEWLAAALGWPLITVTPSDFMAQGTAAVEARAQAVFTALQTQRNAVVIFDEIDRLVLDRDRPDYLSSEGAFQLMTPSMLTKLNDLRQGGRVIFLAATNYRERIDSAIVRPGRFDEQLLIAPPDTAERRAYLEQRWLKKKYPDELSPKEQEILATLAEQTWLATYAELKRLVEDASSVEQLEAAVRKVFLPAISLEGYAPRLTGPRMPDDEVIELARLYPPGLMNKTEEELVRKAEQNRESDKERRARRSGSGAS